MANKNRKAVKPPPPKKQAIEVTETDINLLLQVAANGGSRSVELFEYRKTIEKGLLENLSESDPLRVDGPWAAVRLTSAGKAVLQNYIDSDTSQASSAAVRLAQAGVAADFSRTQLPFDPIEVARALGSDVPAPTGGLSERLDEIERDYLGDLMGDVPQAEPEEKPKGEVIWSISNLPEGFFDDEPEPKGEEK